MKRTAFAALLSGLISLFTLGLSGCGSSTQPIGIGLTSSATGIDQAQTVSITASVTNDAKNGGVTWSVSGGGTLSGTTTNAATYNAPASVTKAFTATVTATSVTDATKTAALQIGVNPLPAVTISSLPAATAGTAYNQTLTESGGTNPFTWTSNPATLPPGLSLSSKGVISGTPTGGGSGSFTFQITDATKATASSGAVNFVVNPPAALSVTTASLPAGATGTAYSQTLQATGGVPSYNWSYTGTLPAGLSLNSAGVISGTPTATGTSNFTVTVTDSGTPTPQTAQANLSIKITLGPLVVTTTSSSLPQAVVNGAYSATVTATGGLTPYTWSISGNPSWLSINKNTGALSGTPTATGTTPAFTVTVADSENPQVTANASLTITVNAALAITTQSLPGGSVGTAYSATVNATGGVTPYLWSISGNPSWLSINKNTGALSGTPTATGTTPAFTVTVTDSESPQATANASLTITVAAASCTNNATLSGNYAMVLRGWSSSTTFTAAVGSFVADGQGNISGGSLDVDDQGSGPGTGTFTGTFCVDSKNLATVSLTYGGGLSGSDTFEAALDASDGNGHIIFYDSSNVKASGVLRKQDTSAFSTSKIKGNYAFGFAGVDAAFGGATSARYVTAGQFDSNGTGTLSGSYDSDIYGNGVVSDQTLSTSDLSVVSGTTGRGTVSITFNNSNAYHGTLNFVFYVVSATELLVMEDDAAGYSLLTGQVVGQSGTFTDTSLDGVSVLELEGTDSEIASAVTAGLLTTDGKGNFSLSLDENIGGTFDNGTGNPTTESGTYQTSSNGRVALSVSGSSAPPVLYLVGQNEAFVVGTDGSVSFGFMWAQSGSNFTKASLSGTYLGGSREPVSTSVGVEVDSISADGKGNLTGTSDTNSSASGTGTNSITATYTTSSSGRVVASQSGSVSMILYIVSSSQAVALPTQSSNPKMIDIHQ